MGFRDLDVSASPSDMLSPVAKKGLGFNAFGSTSMNGKKMETAQVLGIIQGR